MINIDSSHPDLLHSDSRDLVILGALTNLRLEWGDLAPLYATIETWMSSEYRLSRRGADDDLCCAIRRAHAAGDEDNVLVIDAVRRSRAARAKAFDDYAYQLWELLT